MKQEHNVTVQPILIDRPTEKILQALLVQQLVSTFSFVENRNDSNLAVHT